MGSDGVRTTVGIGVGHGEVMHGGRRGLCEVVHGGSDGDHCYELWLISGFVELWSNEHAC